MKVGERGGGGRYVMESAIVSGLVYYGIKVWERMEGEVRTE